MKIIRQASALQTYLSANASKLRASKTLIVASAAPPPPDDNMPQKTDQKLKKFHSSFEQHIGQCHFLTGMQHNLQTVSYGYGKDNYTLAGAYPTPQNVDATVALMKRTGAIHVMGVGSGAAMDLAKATYYRSIINNNNSESNNEDGDNVNAGQLILNPSTLGATVASVARGGLVMDPDEEALLPLPLGNYANANANSNSNVSVLIDDKAMCIPSWIHTSGNSSIGAARSQRGASATIVDSALASLVMALDAAYSYGEMDHDNNVVGGDDNNDHYRALLQESISGSLSCLNAFQSISNNDHSDLQMQMQEAIQSGRQHAIQAMISSGQLLSYGALNANENGDTDGYGRRRNIALAFTSALLPKYFPHGNWCTFTASLLPGLCHAIDTEDSSMVEDNSMLQHALSLLYKGSASTSAFEWANNLNAVSHGDGVASIHVPSLASMADGTPDPNNMIQKVEDNGAFVNCIDADSSYLENVFMTSMNR